MRALLVSLLIHAGIIAVGLIYLPKASQVVENTPIGPVQLVALSERTNVRAAAPEPERETSQAFAARLREAAAGVDREALADRAAELREGREAEERQAELDAARERELERQQEIEKERDSIAERDRDRGHSL